MAEFKGCRLLDCMLLVSCSAGLFYQTNMLYHEYSTTIASELEYVDQPSTHPPAVTVCFPLMRLFNRSVIYGRIWEQAFSPGRVFSSPHKYSKYAELIDGEGRILNETLANDRNFARCLEQFASWAPFFMENVTLQDLMENWLGVLTRDQFITVTVTFSGTDGKVHHKSFTNFKSEVSQICHK